MIGDADAFAGLQKALGRLTRRFEHVVLTADLRRVSRKYLGYAYRLVHLDAGCAIGQCHVVCRSLGYEVQLASRWSDARIGELLAADPATEPVTAILSLAPDERKTKWRQ
jgi:hypothetical protein